MFDSSFEIKFSQLADARLQEMVPSLNQYKVGFQLIEKDEDSTKGVGVMAFLVNNTWVYIPTFFLSGKLKLPCLYIKNYDIRVPLSDSWVSYIKSNELATLGELVDTGSVKVDDSKADLLNIIGKKSSEKNDLMDPEEIQLMFSSSPCNDTNLMDSLRKTDKETFIKLAEEMNANDDFANAIFKFYSPQNMRKVAEYLDSLPEDAPEVAPVRTLTKESMEAKDLKEDEKVKMLREGKFIKDDRIETSLVYQRANAVRTGFETPSQPGFYDVLMSDGNTKECIIVFPNSFRDITYPTNHNRRQISSRCAIISKDKPTQYVKATASNVLVKNPQEIKQSGIKGSPVSINNDLNRKKLAEMNTETILLVDSTGNAFTLGAETEWPKVYFTGKPGKIHLRNGVLMIPENILLFKQVESFDETGDVHIALGDVNTFVNECVRKAEMGPLKVFHDSGTGYYITSAKADKGSLKKQAALELLVYQHGIRAGEAEAMLKEAADHGSAPKTCRYLIKYAGVYDLSTDMGTIGREVSSPVASDSIVPPSAMTDLAMKASDTGLKEVLDTSIMASLIGTSKTMNKVGDFMPDLIKAMDRLGSILCLYYWDNEEFEEQYGRVEMVELEEKLVDIFSSMGDITLFLKEKTTDADSLFDGNKGNISEDMGDI